MPDNHKRYLLCTLWMLPFIALIMPIIPIHADEGIETYYIRYDVKSSKNKIIADRLVMVPAKNDFRAEKFSYITETGVISAVYGESNLTVEKRIKENALKSTLVKKGLNSIKTKDHDTVVSYEGVIITPLNILKNTYNEGQSNYFYEVQIEFSPIAFPDEWETLNMKYKIKGIFHDFFQLFK